MTKKKPANITDAAWRQRQRVWRHNSFSGHARMMEMQLKGMIDSDSTDWFTKDVARIMYQYVESLKSGLKTRIDP